MQVIDLINRAIEKYGSILDAPEDCEEFIQIREMSPDKIKEGTPEYSGSMADQRRDLIIKYARMGYPAKLIAEMLGLNHGWVRTVGRRNGVKFISRFIWYGKKDGEKYYSPQKDKLKELKIKNFRGISKFYCDLPAGAHYFADGEWHVKKNGDDLL